MHITDFFFARPRFSQVICAGFVLLGALALSKIGMREYPFLKESTVSVSIAYPNASPETVESRVTQVIEDALSSVEGVDLIVANSASGSSNITINFLAGTDGSVAVADVRDRLSRIRGRLPIDIDEPVISKANEDDTPLTRMIVISDKLLPYQLADYVQREIRPIVAGLPGVSDVSVFGGSTPAMRVRFDPQKLSAAKITPSDIEQAIVAQNIEQPAGRIEGNNNSQEASLRIAAGLNNVSDLSNAIIKQGNNGGVIRLKDIATISEGPENERSILRYNGQSAVQIGIVPTLDADTPTLSRDFRRAQEQISAKLPANIRIESGYDTSVFVKEALWRVAQAVAEAAIIVMVVMLLFLRSWRAGIAPLLVLPIALLGTAIVLKALGYTLNLLSLTAAVPAAGLVVDDAVVVTENIMRRRSEGLSMVEAARKGAAEVMPAILTMTLVTPAAFLPLFFMNSRNGKLLSEFATVLSISVIISGICAAILTPRVCAYFLQNAKTDSIEPWIVKIGNYLVRVLWHPWRSALLAAALLSLSAAVYTMIGQELAPSEDRGAILITGTLPDGSSPSAANTMSLKLESMIQKMPYRAYTIAYAGIPDATSFRMFVVLPSVSSGRPSVEEIAAQIRNILKEATGVKTNVVVPAAPARSLFGKPVQIVLKGAVSRELLNQTAQKAINALQKAEPRLIALENDLKANTPRPDIFINRERVAAAGISMIEIARAITATTGQIRVSEYTDRDRRYRIVLETDPTLKQNADIFNKIWVRGANQQMVPLGNLIDVVPHFAPQQLSRYDRAPAVTITANVSKGLSLGDALKTIDNVVKPLLPENVTLQRAGTSRDFSQAAGDFVLVVPAVLFCIFGLLSILYESYRAAAIVLCTVPLTIGTAILVIYFTGQTLNLYTQAGLLTLIGLVTKHGTLLVDTAMLYQQQGLSHIDAMARALQQRLRPILMTTAAMVMGTFPLLWASGAGAIARYSIGITLLGGLVGGTVLTMLCIGLFYRLLAHRGKVG